MEIKRPFRYARRFREITQVLIRHGFGFLLEQLQAAEILGIPLKVLRLKRVEPRPSRIRALLEELGPTFIKLGQILSTRADLIPPDYLAELSRLQDNVAPLAGEEIQKRISEELGRPFAELFPEFDPTPLASASIAQVHRATLPGGEQVVVKVQRPQMERTIRVDLEILAYIARLAQHHTAWGKLTDFEAIVDSFGTVLREELDFTSEGLNAERFQANFQAEPAVRFPRVYWDYSSKRVLTLELIEGTKITAWAEEDEVGRKPERRRLAKTLTQAILKQIFLDGFFHADPHPGNLLVDKEGRLVFLDLGMVGYLNRQQKWQLLAMIMSVVRRRSAAVVRALLSLGLAGEKVDQAALERDIERLLARYWQRPLGRLQIGEALNQVMSLAFKHQIRIPAEFTMIAKALVTVEGIIQQLDPTLSLMEIASPFSRVLLRARYSPANLQEMASEEWQEWVTLLHSLPQNLNRVLAQASQGELTLHHVYDDLEKLSQRATVIANRLTLSILAASMVIGTALFFQGRTPTLLSRFPLAELSFLLALGLGFSLFWAIIKSGRW